MTHSARAARRWQNGVAARDAITVFSAERIVRCDSLLPHMSSDVTEPEGCTQPNPVIGERGGERACKKMGVRAGWGVSD